MPARVLVVIQPPQSSDVVSRYSTSADVNSRYPTAVVCADSVAAGVRPSSKVVSRKSVVFVNSSHG